MTIPGVNEQIIDIYLAERTTSAQNNLPPPLPPPSDGSLPITPSNEMAFSVYSEALFPDRRRAGISAVIFRSNNPLSPFVFLEWKKQYPGEDSLFAESVVVVTHNGADGL